MNAIRIENASLRGRAAALEDVSLEVQRGESVALAGGHQPSLSLVVRACFGFVRPQRGRISVAGCAVESADRAALLRLRRSVGYVSISGGLLSNMTLRENLEMVLRYYGVDRSEARARVSARIDAVDLRGAAELQVSVAPAELCKCFAYLRALLMDPEIVLSEDPSAFLHPKGREIVTELHENLRARGAAVLVADDDVEFVRPWTERVVCVDGGARR